jgi:hypothetical protein
MYQVPYGYDFIESLRGDWNRSQQAGCHLVGVYIVPRARLKTRLGVTFFVLYYPHLRHIFVYPLLQQRARSGFSFYRGREEALHYGRL